MILGLTLAEVLLLLLFLLMLALGSELIELQEKLSNAKDGQAAIENIDLKADLKSTVAELSEYKRSFPDLKLAAELKLAFDEAKKVNPNDPAAALKAGVELQKTLGELYPGKAADDLDLRELLKKAGELSELQAENKTLKTQMAENTALDIALQNILQDVEDTNGVNNLESLLSPLKSLARYYEQENNETPTATELQEYVESNFAGYKNSKSKWPPIISLSEANGHFFERGSAALTREFRSSLETQIPDKLIELLKQYEVDTIEVIGHTDEQPIRGQESNLDDTLLSAVKGGDSEDFLVPADNAGLGMARAVSVTKILRAHPQLKNWEIIPLSGAQLIESDGKLSHGNGGDVKERRRIEIRLRGSAGGIIEGASPDP